MVVSPACGSDEKGGITGGEDLRLLQPEHSCTVHCDQFHYGPVSGSVEASGVTGGEVMVVIGRLRFGTPPPDCEYAWGTRNPVR